MNNWLQYIIITLYVFQLLSLIAVVFIENKDPVSTLSWMLVLSFLPIIGFILYLFFGRGLRGITDKKLKLTAELQKIYLSSPLKNQEQLLKVHNMMKSDDTVFESASANKNIKLIKMNYNLGTAPYLDNNDVKIYIDAKEKYADLFKDIRNATTSVHLTYFIISNTNISHKLIDLLAEKAKEGVEVCLIYDDIGNILVPKKMFSKIKEAGGKVLRFFPLSPRRFFRANYRNHHKIVVVDGVIGYTGGMNIGDEYMGLHPRKTPWRDTHLRITGGAVSSLQFLFLQDLVYTTGNLDLTKKFITSSNFPPPIVSNNIGMQIVASGPDNSTEVIRRAYIEMINSAKKTVYIQTPYLMPDQAVMNALQNTASSGVDVYLMLPGIPDKKMVYMVTYSYIKSMLDYGVKVYIYNGFLHAKMIVVDDEISTIGTTNMDMRSFSMHFELNDFIYDTEVSKECGDIFRNDLKDSWLMTKEKYNSRSNIQKILEKILRLFAPLM